MSIPFPHRSTDRVALGDDGARTAAELHAAAAAVAGYLEESGARRIILACEDRLHFATGLLAAWSAGCLVVLPPSTQPASLDELEGRSGAILLHDRIGEGRGVDIRRLLDHPAVVRPRWPAWEDDAVEVATSGSTGSPRRMPKTLRQLLGEAKAHQGLFGVGQDATFLVMAPPHHIYGLLFGLLLPLSAGAAFVRQSALHPEEVVEAVTRHGVTHVVGVPSHLAVLAASSALPPVARVFSSGAPLRAGVARRLEEKGWPVTEIFGSSETGGVAWRVRRGEAWRLLPGVAAAVGEDGRLEVDGPFLHPAQPRPFVTADLARLTTGGLELLGRADDVVKVGGKRVSLREIEERAAAVPGVSDAAALCREAEGARAAEVWLAVAGRGVTARAVRAELARWIDPVACPRRVRVVEVLPREPTGKLTRRRLLEVLEREPGLPGPGKTSVAGGDEGREQASAELTFSPDPTWFVGHFPGHPVLAGVVQLQAAVVRESRRLWPGLGVPRRILRLKFRRVVTPGEEVRVRLVHHPAALRVDFELETRRGQCASGSVLFSPACEGGEA